MNLLLPIIACLCTFGVGMMVGGSIIVSHVTKCMVRIIKENKPDEKDPQWHEVVPPEASEEIRENMVKLQLSGYIAGQLVFMKGIFEALSQKRLSEELEKLK